MSADYGRSGGATPSHDGSLLPCGTDKEGLDAWDQTH